MNEGLSTCLGLLCCPVCGEAFAGNDRALACANRHSFDIAREGYVNLLRGKPRGDDRMMLRARRAFLERGHYAPIGDALGHIAAEYLSAPGGEVGATRWVDPAPGADAAILDVGCGEGYYLGRLRDHLALARPGSRGEALLRPYLGLDVSRDAVRMAARRYPFAGFVTADVKAALPIATGAVDVLLDVFAPRNAEEFARVLAPGGLLLVAVPGAAHLERLRRELSLIGIEEDKPDRLARMLSGSFELLDMLPFRYALSLDAEDVADLVAMTPNRWHATERTWERARSLGGVTDTVDVSVLRFRRNS